MLGHIKDLNSSAVCVQQCSGILCWKSVLVQSDSDSKIVLWVESPGTSIISSPGNIIIHVLSETGWWQVQIARVMWANSGLTEKHDYILIFFSAYFLVNLTFLEFIRYLKTCSEIGNAIFASWKWKVYVTGQLQIGFPRYFWRSTGKGEADVQRSLVL